MTAKEYLKSIRSIDRQIDVKLEQASRLRARAERMTTTFSPTRGSGRTTGGGASGSIDKLIDLEREINQMVDELVDEKRAALAAIQAVNVNNGNARTLLEMRYLLGYSWEQVGRELGYERTQIHRLHGIVLRNFQIPKRWHTMEH